MKSLHIFRICATICVALFTQALLASTINLNSGTYKDLYLDADTVRINGNVTVTDTMYITSGTKVIFNGDHTLDV